MRRHVWRVGVMVALAIAALVPESGAAPKVSGGVLQRVEFDRDILPILANNCFACHGPDEQQRKAKLRLDQEKEARRVLVPGKSRESRLFHRVSAAGTPASMPPPSFPKKLTPRQIETLRRWIDDGAPWAAHWAFVPPRRPAIPKVSQAAWPRNPIDRFILARLERERLSPSPEAGRPTLIRRLAFDLTGLPPTPAKVSAFVADGSTDAYEKVVDRLLASPHYGERMAIGWLDLARYADTHGYHIDSHRDMWPWRDWVIRAYNENKPFDQFTVEQIAGDLLPNATREQKIATGFNRNHPINYEGGAIPEEYLAAYIADRIDTTATTWMGLTLRCAQCHDHKYDPISQKEYYQIYAYFHSIDEQGLDGQKGNAMPLLRLATAEQQQQLDTHAKKVTEIETALKSRETETADTRLAWEREAVAKLDQAPVVSGGLVAHYALDEAEGEQAKDGTGKQAVATLREKAAREKGKFGGALKLEGEAHVDLGGGLRFDRSTPFSAGAWVNPSSKDHMAVIACMDDSENHRGWDLYLGDGKVWAHLINHWEKNAIRVISRRTYETNQWTHVFLTYDGSRKAAGVKLYVNGRPSDVEVTHDTLTETIHTPTPLLIGKRRSSSPFRGLIDDVRLYERALPASEVEQLVGHEPVREILTTAADKRSTEQSNTLRKYFLENVDAPYHKLSTELAEWKKKQEEFDKTVPSSMVMQELDKPRETHLLVRGQYDKLGDKVSHATLTMLPPQPMGAAANRLSLARWLVGRFHPLTSRVAVNHYWQQYFGMGLVKTSENFGTQGERPSHPELLDWLATEFVHTGWDVKRMQRLIVTSATYRQSSRVTPALYEKDPENRLLARGARFRLPAELIRDQALAVSGLLAPKVGGPSVKPYHPAGLWEEIAFGGDFTAQKYVRDSGESLYRRSMYTFWKRTCPPPSLMTFDAPEREFCIVRRSVTNTPLQALVLMNDPTYVEAARKFAEKILLEAPRSAPARIGLAYRHALSRAPRPTEIKLVTGVLNEQLAAFRKDGARSEKLLAVGESPRDQRLDPTELAAWTMIASMLLNLDEAITKG